MVIDLKGYRIFIATPGGLDDERRAFRRVISEYNDSDAVRRGVMFLPVGWEITLGGVGRPQALINKELQECDYLVLVLWDRWGSSTGNEPGASFTSGTEEEYSVAIECFKDSGLPMRQLVVFFKAVDERKLSDPGEQLKKVLAFKEQLEKEKTLLFYTYDEVSTFESRLRAHLAQWVRDHEDGDTDKKSPPDSSTTAVEAKSDSTPSISVNVPTDTTANDLVEEAKKLAFEGRLTEAETLFARAVASKNDLSTLFSYGLFLSQLGRLAQAKTKYERVINLADEVYEPVWKARALNSLGNDYKSREDLDEAEKMYRQSLVIFQQLDNSDGIADVYNNLGDLFQARENLDQAAAMYQQSLEIKERLGSQEGMADLYGNLGNVYKAQGKLDQAEAMHRQSLELKESLGIQEGLADVYSNLGNLYQARENSDDAERMYRQSLELFQQLNDKEGAADIYSNLGNVYHARGELDVAEAMYQQSLEIYEQLRDQSSMADVYNNLGNVYVTRKDFDKAEDAYRQSLEIFELLRDKEGMADVYNNLADVYKARGDADQAEVMNRKSMELLQ